MRTEFGNVDGYLRVFDVAFQKVGQGVLQFVQSFAFGLNFACQWVSDVTTLIYPGTAADLVGLRVALLDRGVEVGVRPNHDIEDVAAADAVAVGAFALLQTLVVLRKYRRLAHFFDQVGRDGVNGNVAVVLLQAVSANRVSRESVFFM